MTRDPTPQLGIDSVTRAMLDQHLRSGWIARREAKARLGFDLHWDIRHRQHLLPPPQPVARDRVFCDSATGALFRVHLFFGSQALVVPESDPVPRPHWRDAAGLLPMP